MNKVIYNQMKKIRAQTEFITEFNEIYDLQEEELCLAKEECLAERVAITMLKTDPASTTTEQKA